MKTETPPVELSYYHWHQFHASFDWISHNDVVRDTPASYSDALSPHYIATWVISGTIHKQTRHQSLKASAGEWLFQQPGKNIATTLMAGSTHLEIGFSIEWQGEGSLYLPPKQVFWKTTTQPELEEKAIRLRQLMRTIGPRVSWDYDMRKAKTAMGVYLQYNHLFFDWLASWENTQRQHGMGWYYAKKQDEKVANAMHYLTEHPLHLPVNIDEMAKSQGISTVHMIHLFREAYHTTPKAYRMKLKLKKALHELQTTRKEIKEIASGLGYSAPWFCIWIKQETGKTPTEIRNEGFLD